MQVYRCFCGKPGTVPAIGAFDIVDLGAGTIPLSFCAEHADLLTRHLEVTMRVEEPDRPYAGTLHQCPVCGLEHDPPRAESN